MNHTYFNTWSANMAYILGFAMADGSIRHKDYCKTLGYALVFALNLKDKEILDFIKTELNTKAKVNIYKWTGSDGIYREQANLCISSKILVDKLIELGVIPQKTGKETFPEMPKEFEIDFIRGYFDGDGCIQNSFQKQKDKIYKKYLFKLTCANKDFLIECRERFNNLGSDIRYHGSNCYTWQVQSKKDILSIKNLFYKNNNFTLDRKKQIFFDIEGQL